MKLNQSGAHSTAALLHGSVVIGVHVSVCLLTLLRVHQLFHGCHGHCAVGRDYSCYHTPNHNDEVSELVCVSSRAHKNVRRRAFLCALGFVYNFVTRALTYNYL